MKMDVIVIGAGLTGLTAARELEAAGKHVIVLEKEACVGGRMASMALENGFADYGAQFFTARTPGFQRQVDIWQEQNLLRVWGYAWSDGSLKRTIADAHPRYIASEGMKALTQELAASLQDLRLDVQVNSIYWLKNKWQIVYNENVIITADVLILTPPVPQSLALLSDVKLTKTDLQALARIHYRSCLTGVFAIDGEINLPEPGAIQDLSQALFWIADNKAKGISPQRRTVTVQAESMYSDQHFGHPEEEVLSTMADFLQQYLAEGACIVASELKRWRYSQPVITDPFDILKAWGLPLIFAGDAFGGRGRVEGAYLSGLAAGKTAKEL